MYRKATKKHAYTTKARMMEMTHVKNPFIPFSLKGLVRNSNVFKPAIHRIGPMAITIKAMIRKLDL